LYKPVINGIGARGRMIDGRPDNLHGLDSGEVLKAVSECVMDLVLRCRFGIIRWGPFMHVEKGNFG
jgi:hypothetical protein